LYWKTYERAVAAAAQPNRKSVDAGIEDEVVGLARRQSEPADRRGRPRLGTRQSTMAL
jgi:hypothetical protein